MTRHASDSKERDHYDRGDHSQQHQFFIVHDDRVLQADQ